MRLQIHQRSIFPRLRWQRRFASGWKFAGRDGIGVRLKRFLVRRLDRFFGLVRLNESRILRSQGDWRKIDKRQLDRLFLHWKWRCEDAAQHGEQVSEQEMNEDRREQRPQHRS